MRISIVTAVFNQVSTIADTLEAVAGQRYAEIEHVVVDGASTDGTLDVIDRHRANIDVFISEKDRGVYDALNKGIARSTGDVIGFLHADDMFAGDDVISKISAKFADPEIDAVYGDLMYVGRSDPGRAFRYWRAGEYSRSRLKRGWMPPHPTFYVRRAVYERWGCFDTSFRIAADYDCMLRFLGRGGVAPSYIPELLVKMRVGGLSNRSIRNVLAKSREDYLALRRNQIGGLGALAWKNLSKLPQFFKW